MEYWSGGVMEYWIKPQYSDTPTLQFVFLQRRLVSVG
jgi:hypothetical protein